uniref:hypothetical protein n=1 Tax=Staphylococcus epidermidis TaxID=1282 RepID=UPI001642D5DF
AGRLNLENKINESVESDGMREECIEGYQKGKGVGENECKSGLGLINKGDGDEEEIRSEREGVNEESRKLSEGIKGLRVNKEGLESGKRGLENKMEEVGSRDGMSEEC